MVSIPAGLILGVVGLPTGVCAYGHGGEDGWNMSFPYKIIKY